MSGFTQYSKCKIFVLVPKQLVSWNHSYHKRALNNVILSELDRWRPGILTFFSHF